MSGTSARISVHGSLQSLTSLYDGLLLDQWGVIHDGTRPAAGAVEALRRTLASGTKVAIVSNSTARAAATLQRLEEMGFDEGMGLAVITSGEVNYQGFLSSDPYWAELGTRCLVFGNRTPSRWLQGLEAAVRPVDTVAEAQFVFALGLDSVLRADGAALPMAPASFTPLLREAAAARLPMLCANPDVHVVTAEGALRPVVGALAREYESYGGAVRYVGKPHPHVFEAGLAALAAAGVDDKRRIAMVGDSLHHDVRGAIDCGVDSVWVPGGVHFEELGIAAGPQPTPGPGAAELRAVFERHRTAPTHVLLGFRSTE